MGLPTLTMPSPMPVIPNRKVAELTLQIEDIKEEEEVPQMQQRAPSRLVIDPIDFKQASANEEIKMQSE